MPIVFAKRDARFSGGKTISMTRRILTLCCLGLLGGAIASALLVAGERSAGALNGLGCRALRPGDHRAGDRYLDYQYSPPLVADAEETDDTEEQSDRDKCLGTPLASLSGATSPSPGAACFEAAIQHRLPNTLNALGVRLQI